jgi:hypothetical protein
MRMSDLEPATEAVDPFKPQMDAANRMAKDAKMKKAKIRADKAQAALRRAQQS